MNKLITKFAIFFILGTHQISALKIGLDWVINPQHGLFIYAIKKGHLPKNTKLLPFQSSSKALLQLSLNAVDIALSYEPNINAAIEKKGFKIKHFFTICSVPLDCFISHVPVCNLKGKKIGHQSSVGSITEMYMKIILKQNNLEFSDITPVYSLYNLKQGLLLKQFDAAMNIDRASIPELKRYNKDLYVYQYADFGINYSGQVLAAGEDTCLEEVKENLAKAKIEILEDPSRAWNIIVTEKPELNSSANKEKWLEYCKLMSS